MLKILLTRQFLNDDIVYIENELRKRIGDNFQVLIPDSFSEDRLRIHAEEANVFLGPHVTAGLIETAKNLRLIQVPWTGMDTFPFAAIRGCSIPLCNSHSNSAHVAEFAIGLLFSLIKKVPFHDRKMRKGNWNRSSSPLSLSSPLLFNKAVGIIGYGAIGRKIASYLLPYECRIHILCREITMLKEETIQYFTQREISSFLAKTEILFLSVPLTQATKNLLDAQTFAFIRDGCFIVNVARAAILDECALYDALVQGKIGGYASDVWWNAPERGGSEAFPSKTLPFEKLDNVVFSPHRAGFAESGFPHLDDAIENIASLYHGRPLKNQILPTAEY